MPYLCEYKTTPLINPVLGKLPLTFATYLCQFLELSNQ